MRTAGLCKRCHECIRKKSKHIEYCDRALIFGPYVGLVLREEDYVTEAREMKCPEPGQWLRGNCRATVHTFHPSEMGNRWVSVICYDQASADKDKCSRNEVLSSLVHEATHVWQNLREEIGEEHPSREFEAYSVDKISFWLFEAYDRALKRYRKLEKKQ